MSALHAVLAVVVVQRLLELAVAAINTRRLKAMGAVEVGRGHYPLFVLLHGAWLGSMAVLVPPATAPFPAALAALAALMLARAWVMVSLGPYWTTRIITLPSAPLVRRGPYRFLRHPNYLVVAGEIALLPLAFGAVDLAVVFSVLNGALLAWRIAIEDKALSCRPVTGL
jgi:Uncharacterized protein conserved in bacteria